MKIDIEKAKEAFKEYVKNYDPKDKQVKLKIEHIERVSQLARQMAEKLKLNEEDIQLAELIGLLHDIGRFEQIRIYHTFIDKKSINHGEFGAKVLFEEGLTERQMLHAKLVRDADKTDIFYGLIKGEEKTVWESDNMNDEIVTNEIYREFIEDKHINYKNIETSGDILVAHFAYIYDLYFKPTLKIFKDKKYVDQLYNRFNFTNKDTAQKFKVIHEKTKQYIEEKG